MRKIGFASLLVFALTIAGCGSSRLMGAIPGNINGNPPQTRRVACLPVFGHLHAAERLRTQHQQSYVCDQQPMSGLGSPE